MSHYSTTPQDKDPYLWRIAQARASFKRHFFMYTIMAVVFWVIWFFTGSKTYEGGLPWPVWPMFGWGIGIFFHYLGAYHQSIQSSAETEYEKLIQNQNK